MDDSRDTVIMKVADEHLEGEDFIKFFSKAGTIKVIEILHCIYEYVFSLMRGSRGGGGGDRGSGPPPPLEFENFT